MGKTIAIIPARGGSKRILNKNIKLFNGVPLILWTLAEAFKVKEIDRLIVSTDSQKLIEILNHFNFEYILRPNVLSGDEISSEDVLLNVLGEVKDEYETLAFVQCTNPFDKSEVYTDVINTLIKDKNANSAFAASKFKGWLWKKDDLYSKGVNHKKEVRIRSQDIFWDNYIERGSIVALKISSFKNSKQRFYGNTLIVENSNKFNIDIDDIEDFELAELAHKFIRSKIKFKNIKLIVADFDGVFSSNKVSTSNDGLESVKTNKYDSIIIKDLLKKVDFLILSSEKSQTTSQRANKLNVDCIDSAGDKKTILKEVLFEKKLKFNEVAYIGNDLNDLLPMMMCGYSFCPKDSAKEIKSVANEVIPLKGGKGIIRYIYEKYYSFFENLS